MRIVGVLVVIAATTGGCITQRSLMLGQMASAVGKGGADLSVSTGAMYAAQTSPPYDTTVSGGETQSNQASGKGFSLPWFEANANYGLSDRVGLNLHMSPAGIQPGAKFTLNRSLIAHIALLPQVGVGYGSTGTSTFVAGSNGIQTEVSPTSVTRFLFTAGLKVLISHRSGFFSGLGYDLYYTRSANNGTTGTGGTVMLTQTINTSLEHLISIALGFNVAVGMVSIRPELDFAVIPAISTTSQSGLGNTVGASGGFGYAFLGGFGFALTTPPNKRDTGAEEDEKNVGPEGDEKPAEEEAPPPKEKRRDRDEDN